MTEIKGDWKDENVIREIWTTHFHEKPMPKIQVLVLTPGEYLRVVRQLSRLPHARAKELMMKEYGHKVVPKKTAGCNFYYKCEDTHYVLIRSDSKYTDEYNIEQEMRDILQKIDAQGRYVGATGKPTHPRRPPRHAFRNRAR